MNQGWTYHNRVSTDAVGITLLDYYADRYPHSTRSEWQDRITTGKVLLNGQPTTADIVLQVGQRLTYHRPPWDEPPVPLNIEVLHEDDDVLVVVKPSGLPVLPGAGFLEHTLLWQLQQRYPPKDPNQDIGKNSNKNLRDKPVPVHRLGRGTSGLVLIARTQQARAHLSQQMRSQQINKVYRALIGPTDLPDEFTISQPIGKVPHPLLGDVYGAVSSSSSGRLLAHSECRVLTRRANSTLLDVQILTGRPHQIRIHLASVGYPLLGDPLYGVGGTPTLLPGRKTMAVPGDCGYCLHAYQLIFMHPTTGQRLELKCPPPAELCD